MTEDILFQLAAIIIIGIFAQWLGWRIRLPAILLLLLGGIIAGPLTGFLKPDEIFGDILFPLVSFSVALILFEGGLSLRLDDLQGVGTVVRNLVTIGALIVWALMALAAHYLVGLELSLAVLLGAILIVSGPTVVLPLLLYVRPNRKLSAILRWEGIVIDPVGATLGVLVFEVIVVQSPGAAIEIMLFGILKTLLIGGLTGALGAAILYVLLRRYWLPEFLQNSVALVLVIGTYTLADLFQSEAGLLAVTVMGVILANQKRVEIRQIVEFKENLRVLLLSGLFVLLAARIDINVLRSEISWGGIGFVLVAVLLARPLSVLVSTIGTDLNWREKAFLSWMAPRGIVAASVSAVFALRLEVLGYEQANRLVSLTFLLIIITVALYGLTSMPVARWLKVAQASPQGILVVGAHAWAQEIARLVQEAGFRALLVDTNYLNILSARAKGLQNYYGSILSEEFWNEVDLEGIGKLLALTSNDEVNSLAAIRSREVLGRNEVYQLCPAERSGISHELGGRLLFYPGLTFAALTELFETGAELRLIEIKSAEDLAAFEQREGHSLQPLLAVNSAKELLAAAVDKPLNLHSGQKVIALAKNSTE